MSMRANKAAFCRFLDQAVNNGKLATVDEIFHRDFIGYFPGVAAPVRGPEGCRRWVGDLRSSFADLNAFIEGGWLAGELGTHEAGKGAQVERVVALVVLRGTHAGEFTGVPATGREITWTQAHLLSFVEGLIIQDIAVSDTLGQLRQMGVTDLNVTTASALLLPELI